MIIAERSDNNGDNNDYNYGDNDSYSDNDNYGRAK